MNHLLLQVPGNPTQCPTPTPPCLTSLFPQTANRGVLPGRQVLNNSIKYRTMAFFPSEIFRPKTCFLFRPFVKVRDQGHENRRRKRIRSRGERGKVSNQSG
ncbi:hypothetical protein CEXT_52751 [Caerostris extrusa]|uniref:Uncharacterized protein n=1 Tax=Caerostris extrusa TaxID=172846 RepID=A0AAV4TQ07_CAEEX|nr:hypothetical protein CEXT_52751 [Caerostris extrusa]